MERKRAKERVDDLETTDYIPFGQRLMDGSHCAADTHGMGSTIRENSVRHSTIRGAEKQKLKTVKRGMAIAYKSSYIRKTQIYS